MISNNGIYTVQYKHKPHSIICKYRVGLIELNDYVLLFHLQFVVFAGINE